MTSLPSDPFALVAHSGFAPARRRHVPLLGTSVELCWLPERRDRQGKPTPDRPPFGTDAAARIDADESRWSGAHLALTPNRHPFAERHLLLWSTRPAREPDRAFLEAGFELAAATGGALLVNSIGAAASLTRAHAHLIAETQPFLPSIALEPHELAALEGHPVAVDRASPAFPAVLIALRGTVTARAAATERLLLLRTCAAFGLVAQQDTTWVFPRSREVPAPHFPQPLGSAELWGRWCFDEEAAWQAATADDLVRALALAGYPSRSDGSIRG